MADAEWNFEVEEVSAGIYRATGEDPSGRRVERTGSDPDALLARCREDACAVDAAKREGQ